jgi:hypothetical protein
MLAYASSTTLAVVLYPCLSAHSKIHGTYGLPSGPSIMPFASFLYPGLPAMSCPSSVFVGSCAIVCSLRGPVAVAMCCCVQVVISKLFDDRASEVCSFPGSTMSCIVALSPQRRYLCGQSIAIGADEFRASVVSERISRHVVALQLLLARR